MVFTDIGLVTDADGSAFFIEADTIRMVAGALVILLALTVLVFLHFRGRARAGKGE